MKTATIVLAGLMALGFSSAMAEETVKEKAAATGNDVKRAAKKAGHRVQEAICMEGDLKCAAEKAGNRVEEGVAYTKDKAKATKNAVDSDEAKK